MVCGRVRRCRGHVVQGVGRAGLAHAAVAAVFIRGKAPDAPLPLESGARLYKLTASEIRVLDAVLKVGSVKAMAEMLGLSQATVKTHLQRLFHKTGMSRQADLVKLVAGFAGPLR